MVTLLLAADPTGLSVEGIASVAAIVFAGLLLGWNRAISIIAKRSKAESREAVAIADEAVKEGAAQGELLAKLGEELGELTLKVAQMQVELDDKNATISRLTGEVNQLRAQVGILIEREQALASENMRLQAQLEAQQA